MNNVVVAITGASGAAYAVRLTQVLLAAGRAVYLTISPSGQAVLRTELGLTVDLERFDPATLLELSDSRFPFRATADVAVSKSATADKPGRGKLTYCHYQDLLTPIASGSFLTGGMVVCPCSGSTLAAIAHAMGTNLIHRAAEVHLKERRKLILVTRETPLSLPQIDAMQRVTLAGGVVLPASPGFYSGAQTLADLVDFVVARVCDQLGVEQQLMQRWGTR